MTASDAAALVVRPSALDAVFPGDGSRPRSLAGGPGGIRSHEPGRDAGPSQREADRHLGNRVNATAPPDPAGRPTAPGPVHPPESDSALPDAPGLAESAEGPAADAADGAGHGGLLVSPAWLESLQRELMNHGDLRRNSKPPEPVINVTIGRVEVRAQAPPSPPKANPKARKPAVMSLDDYLNQRKGRGIS